MNVINEVTVFSGSSRNSFFITKENSHHTFNDSHFNLFYYVVFRKMVSSAHPPVDEEWVSTPNRSCQTRIDEFSSFSPVPSSSLCFKYAAETAGLESIQKYCTENRTFILHIQKYTLISMHTLIRTSKCIGMNTFGAL